MTQEDVAMTVGMAALSMRRHARTRPVGSVTV